jgi:hypothetical protein
MSRPAPLRICRCRKRGNSFSPFTGTIFEKITTGFRKWFYAIHLVLSAKKGIRAASSEETGRYHKTAWRMLRLIREAMGNEDISKAFDVFVEVDEKTYIGGKQGKENAKLDVNGNVIPSDKPKPKRGNKKPVVGVSNATPVRFTPRDKNCLKSNCWSPSVIFRRNGT